MPSGNGTPLLRVCTHLFHPPEPARDHFRDGRGARSPGRGPARRYRDHAHHPPHMLPALATPDTTLGRSIGPRCRSTPTAATASQRASMPFTAMNRQLYADGAPVKAVKTRRANRINAPGRVAQWESARFTRERSQVRNPPRPLKRPPSCGPRRLREGELLGPRLERLYAGPAHPPLKHRSRP